MTFLLSFQFSFEDGKATQELCLEAGTQTWVSIKFLPLSVGQKLANLSLKIPGFRNSAGNPVKSTIPLRGFGAPNQEAFYALPTEETLSESMMDASVHAGQPADKFYQTFTTIKEEET